jgi:hypothetical protein
VGDVAGVAVPGFVEHRHRHVPLGQHGQHPRHGVADVAHPVHDLAGRGGVRGGFVVLAGPGRAAEDDLGLPAEAGRDAHPDRAGGAAASGVAPALRGDGLQVRAARGLADVDHGADERRRRRDQLEGDVQVVRGEFGPVAARVGQRVAHDDGDVAVRGGEGQHAYGCFSGRGCPGGRAGRSGWPARAEQPGGHQHGDREQHDRHGGGEWGPGGPAVPGPLPGPLPGPPVTGGRRWLGGDPLGEVGQGGGTDEPFGLGVGDGADLAELVHLRPPCGTWTPDGTEPAWLVASSAANRLRARNSRSRTALREQARTTAICP